MSFHIRIRPTGLIIQNDSVLLVEYSDHRGTHYFLPGGGAEPGEMLKETVKRELLEETMAEVYVGPLAFVYEWEPQPNDTYSPKAHTLFHIFECSLVDGSVPTLPYHPDDNQVGVKWIPLQDLEKIKLLPYMAHEIQQYVKEKRNIEIVENHLKQRF